MKVEIGNYPENYENRKVEVRIDYHDVWSLDHTLALIIHPALVKLKEVKHGFPYTDTEDAPGEDGHHPGFSLDRWNFILDEMIWTFERLSKDDWSDRPESTYERIKNGLRLFGKYYMSLWD